MLCLVNGLEASACVIAPVLIFGYAFDWPAIGSIELNAAVRRASAGAEGFLQKRATFALSLSGKSECGLARYGSAHQLNSNGTSHRAKC
jgi:hypothetical protein